MSAEVSARERAREEAKLRFLARRVESTTTAPTVSTASASALFRAPRAKDEKPLQPLHSDGGDGVKLPAWKGEEKREADGRTPQSFVHPDRLRLKADSGAAAARPRGGGDHHQSQWHEQWKGESLAPPGGSSHMRRPPLPPDRRPDRPTSPARRPPPALTTGHPGDVDASKAPSPAVGSPPRSSRPSSSPDSPEWVDDEDPTAVDREWYDADEEGGVALDDEGRAFVSAGEAVAPAAREASTAARSVKRLSARAAAVHEDNARWEENRMLQSGVVTATSVDLDFTAETEKRVQLTVLDMKPPFLDGRTAYTTQQEMVSVVKDPTSDLAVIAKKGSALLSSLREKTERGQMKDKFWEVAGSHLGKVIGVKDEAVKGEGGAGGGAGGGEDDGGGGAVDYRASSQFASHLKAPSAAQSEFSASKPIAAQREFLPIYTCKDELMRVIRDNPVTVIVGETGSGKTTQLTQYLYEEGYASLGIIGCTQPRRVAAMSVAKRVSEEFGCALGAEVGYNIRFEDVTSDATLIQYMTEGVLLRESLTSKDLDAYSCIVMDEAHERALNTDVLLGLMRQILVRRRDLKLIVTSATMDADRFSVYFGGAPVFRIPGRTFPVEVLYSKAAVDDYLDGAVKQILTIHMSFPPGDVLVFLTGQEDIEAACVEVAERIDQVGGEVPPLSVLPLYSQLPSELQTKIFLPAPPGVRKVIVSTNLAETSITVDGIRYVIDCGYSKLKVFNPKVGMDSLQATPISRANADQRAGRAGRTGPGVCFRLYTESAYLGEMLANAIPEIQRTNLAHVVLLLKSLGVERLLDFAFLDPPPQETILNSMYALWMLQALDNTGQLTALGRKMVEFPLDPPLSKMLLSAHELGCTAEALAIVSMLSVPTVFFRPADRAVESDAAREKFFVPESDHLTLLHVYQQWLANRCSGQWAARHFLHQKALKKVREVLAQLEDVCTSLHMQPQRSCGHDWDVVRRCIAAAFFHQAARLKGIDSYVNMRSQLPCHLHPTSALAGSGYTPDFLVYHELVLTTKEFMRTVTMVNGEWLAEVAPRFFQLKESYANRAQRRAREQKEREAMEREQKEKEQADQEQREREEERKRAEAQRKKKAVVEIGDAGEREDGRRKRSKVAGL